MAWWDGERLGERVIKLERAVCEEGGIEERLAKLETILGIRRKLPELNSEIDSTSYRLDLTISPDWGELCKFIFPDESVLSQFKVDLKAFNTEEEKNSNPWKIKGEGSFSFQEFHDGVSGLTMTWSDSAKRFVSNRGIFPFETVGTPFGSFAGILGDQDMERRKRYEKSMATHWLFTSATSLSIADDPVRGMANHKVLSTIPFFWEVVNLLLQIELTRHADPMQAIKTFPPALQAKLDEHQVTYVLEHNFNDYGLPLAKMDKSDYDLFNNTEWARSEGVQLYSQRLEEHILRTKYYSVGFNLCVFETFP